MFGADEILVAANKLVGMPGIEWARDLLSVDYVHFLMDGHQIVFAEGLAAESLLLGIEGRKMLPGSVLAALLGRIAEVDGWDQMAAPARFIPQPWQQKSLIRQHRENPGEPISGVGVSDCPSAAYSCAWVA